MGFLDTVVKNHEAHREAQAQEIASSANKRQELMQRTGELKPVALIGPNDTTIPALYCERERAFYPVFD